MTEQERRAVSQEERKEKIRARHRGVDRNELEFIPAKQKEKLFEDTEYSCAVTPQVRQMGNHLSGLAGTAYASLLT